MVKQISPKKSSKRSLRSHPVKNSLFFNTIFISPLHNTTGQGKSTSSPINEQFIKSLKKRNGHYHYQSNSSLGNFADIEAEYIDIKPVAALKIRSNDAYWGAFTKKEIRGPLRLGEYFGAVVNVPAEGSRKEDHLTDHEFYNCFQLTDTTALVPDEAEEFWPRKANCAPCQQTANIHIERAGNRVFYTVPNGITIPEGAQLLPFYGEEYTFEDKVYLNPTDNEEESQDKLGRYPYGPAGSTLDAQLLKSLDLPASSQFYKPLLKQLNTQTVNLPLLRHDARGRVYPQHQQENPTLLHLACWMNDAKTFNALLQHGVYLNQQTSSVGFSATHAIVLSPRYRSSAQKINLLTRIKQEGGSLLLQDVEETSILHLAIKTGQIAIAKAIIKLEPGITSLVNNDDQDYFLYAISMNAIEALEELSAAYSSRFFNDYVTDKQTFNSLVKTIKSVRHKTSTEAFEQLESTVMTIVNDKKPALYNMLLKYFNAPRLDSVARIRY